MSETPETQVRIGHPLGEIGSQVSLQDTICDVQAAIAEQRRNEWKRRQALQPSLGTLLAPTLPERINRLSPSERHDLGRLIKSLKLRKIIRRTLAEAFWDRETHEIAMACSNDSGTMQRLRAAVRTQESLKSYESALTTFDPVVTRSQQSTLIEVPHV